MVTNENRIGVILTILIFLISLFGAIVFGVYSLIIFMTSNNQHDLLYMGYENKDDCRQYCISDSEARWCDYVNVKFISEQINNQTPTMKCVCEERRCLK